MKKIFLTLVAAAFAFAAAPALHAADPAEGFWKSIDEQGKVTAFWKLWVEGGELKGTIVKVPGKPDNETCGACKGDSKQFANKPIIGTQWMYGFKKDGDKWAKGKIVDPGEGKVYWASVTPVNGGSAVQMRGSIDKWGLAGRTQTWKKSSEAEAKAVK